MFVLRRYVTKGASKSSNSLSTLYSANEKLNFDHVTTWNKSVTEAERVIGYPTSFLNLRWLLSDEIANVAVHLRKLLKTDHPILGIAKDLIMNTETPSFGLIVLLISKAGGQNVKFDSIHKDKTAGILHSQRILAEVTEMIKTSNLLHRGLINIPTQFEDKQEMAFGNKIALLCGDYLLSSSYHQLATIKNHSLNDLMSSALRDLAETEFISPRDSQNNPYPSRPNLTLQDVEIPDVLDTQPFNVENLLGNARSEWIVRTLLSGGTLLAKACQGAMKLSESGDAFERHAYKFGRNAALALQAGKEYERVCRDEKISLVSAPVLFYLRSNEKFYDEMMEWMKSGKEVDYSYLNGKIKNSDALEETKRLQTEFSDNALEILNNFSESESRTVLCDLLLAS